MNVNYVSEDKLLVMEITEEIDHHTACDLRKKADYEIQRYRPKKACFDFHHVTFMDSSGIGLLMGRYKLLSMIAGTLFIVNPKPNIRKLFEMSRNY